MITLHADPGADTGGNGTTNALTGANCAYKGIGPAITALEASGPNARGDAVTLKLWNQTGIADTDSGNVMDQFDVTTSATNYLLIEGATALTGVFDHSLWYLETTNRNGIYNNVTPHLRLRNIQVRVISNDGGGHVALKTLNLNLAGNATVDCRVENFILECTGSNKASSLGVNSKDYSSGGQGTHINGLIYGFAQGIAAEDAIPKYANCACYHNDFGIVNSGALIENCVAAFNPSGDYAGTHHASSSNNVSGDGSHGTTGTPALIRPGQRNYIQTSADTVLKNNGATDPLSLSSTTDMRGFTRSTWDIGPFESVAGSSALTGTATASITETDVVNGNKTLIDTLSNDSLVVALLNPEFAYANTKGTLAADSAGGGGGRTGDGTLTCTFPTGFTAQAGYFAVMWVYNDQGDASTPTDWTEIAGSPFGTGTPKMCVFTKTLVGGESAPVTTISGSTTNASHCAQMVVFFNAQLGAIGTSSDGTGTPMTAGAITTTAHRSYVLGLCGRGDNENASGQTFGGSATGVTERADGGTGAGNDSQVSAYCKRIDTSGTSSGNGSATTSATDPWVSVLIEIKAITPYADARAEARTNIDSAQSEATGWDALRTTILPDTAFVRTSNTVRTTTLVAAATYDITAQETVTDTIPASMLNGGVAIAASPTFTIDTAGAPASPGPRNRAVIAQAVTRAAYY